MSDLDEDKTSNSPLFLWFKPQERIGSVRPSDKINRGLESDDLIRSKNKCASSSVARNHHYCFRHWGAWRFQWDGIMVSALGQGLLLGRRYDGIRRLVLVVTPTYELRQQKLI